MATDIEKVCPDIESAAGEQAWFNDINALRGIAKDQANPTIGVAFSGGGVRSATFNLGVLQVLADTGLLKRVGYISSVSGGSYISAWLAAWIYRDGIEHVSNALADETVATGAPKQRFIQQLPIAHLRRYSSYLTPQRGLLSSDTWTAIAAYVLRLMPNLLFVLMLAFVVIVAPYIVRDFYKIAAGQSVSILARQAYEEDRTRLRDSIEDLHLNFVEDPNGLIDDDRDAAFEKAMRSAQSLQVALHKPYSAAIQPAEELEKAIKRLGSFDADASQYDEDLFASLTALRNYLGLGPWQTGARPTIDAAFLADPRLVGLLDNFVAQAVNYPGKEMAAVDDIGSALKEADAALHRTAADELSAVQVDRSDKAIRSLREHLTIDLPNIKAAQALTPTQMNKFQAVSDQLNGRSEHFGKLAWPPYPVSAFRYRYHVLIFFGLCLAALWLPLKPKLYDPLRSTSSRSAAERHALCMFVAILFLGPATTACALYRRLHSEWWLLLIYIVLAVLCTLLYLWRVGALSSTESGFAESPGVTFLGFSVTVLSGASLFWAVGYLLSALFQVGDHADLGYVLAAAVAPVLLLGAYVVMASSGMFFLPYASAPQEWLNRIWGNTAILTLVWLGVALLALVWPPVLGMLSQAFDHFVGATMPTGNVSVSAVTAVLGWIITSAAGIVSAYSGNTGAPQASDSDAAPWRMRVKRDGNQSRLMSFLARMAPYIFVLGLLMVLSSFTARQLATYPLRETDNWLQKALHSSASWWRPEYTVLLLGVLLLLGLGRLIDVNRLSLHNLYRFRLTECYLAASCADKATDLTVAALKANAVESAPRKEVALQHEVERLKGLTRTDAEEAELLARIEELKTFDKEPTTLVARELAKRKAEAIELDLVSDDAKRRAGLAANAAALKQLYESAPPGAFAKFDGPMPLINCTLNVTKSGNLDLQKRRAMNFFFSPIYTGFLRFSDAPNEHPLSTAAATSTGLRDDKGTIVPGEQPIYRSGLIETELCSSKRSPNISLRTVEETGSTLPPPVQGIKKAAASRPITLGAAMAISGAAQSPNEGSHTSPAVAALLTAANVRLGWWLGNPRHPETRTDEGPKNGLLPMIDELFAQATDASKYVYLSDGGHFENLGLFELVRRRCKLIILGDADCDPKYHFDDLVNAMELCQIHFGATIELSTDALLPYGQSKFNRVAYAIGTIKYLNSDPGVLLYLKPAVTNDNTVIVKSFDRESAAFPHEPTANQWFDETQFEAYRLLGRETAVECFRHFKNSKNEKSASPPWWKGDSEKWAALQDQVFDLAGRLVTRQ